MNNKSSYSWLVIAGVVVGIFWYSNQSKKPAPTPVPSKPAPVQPKPAPPAPKPRTPPCPH